MVKRVKKKAYNCSFRHSMLLVMLPLNSSEKMIEGHVADEKEITQLQISTDLLEVLLITAFIEVSSCLGWVCGLL